MRSATHRLLKGAGKVRGGEIDFARQRFHRQTRVELRVHQFERAALGEGGKSTTQPCRTRCAGAGVNRNLLTQTSCERLDERESARISRVRLGDERAEYVSDLRFRNSESTSQLHWGAAAIGRDDAIEEDRVDRHPHVAERAIEADGNEIAGGVDPGAAAAEDDAAKAVLTFDFERERPIVEVHRDVVMNAGNVVDAGDVVATGLESQSGPVERLACHDVWKVGARLDAARLIGPECGIHLDELLSHVVQHTIVVHRRREVVLPFQCRTLTDSERGKRLITIASSFEQFVRCHVPHQIRLRFEAHLL
jgi:hypothetical protein